MTNTRRATVVLTMVTAATVAGAEFRTGELGGQTVGRQAGTPHVDVPRKPSKTGLPWNKRCYYRDWGDAIPFLNKCEGYPESPRAGWDSADRKQLARWIQSLRFAGWSDYHVVTPEKPGPKPRFRIAQIRDAKDVSLEDLGERGLVVARIEADGDGPRDARYGIGQQDSSPWRLRDTFYLVIDPFQKPGTSTKGGKQVSTWYVYGINTSNGQDELVRLPKSGPYRLCDWLHDGKLTENGATFIQCDTAHAVLDIQQRDDVKAALQGELLYDVVTGRADSPGGVPNPGAQPGVAFWLSTNSRRRLSSALRDTERDFLSRVAMQQAVENPYPGWTECGVGCCAADEK